MKRIHKGFLVMVVACLGLWGCARGAGASASAQRVHELEIQVARYKDDYRAAANARDAAQRLVKEKEAERARMAKELEQQQEVAKERDTLRDQLASRVSERDLLQQRCDRMKKGLQSLLGQDEAMAPSGPRSNGISLLTSR